MFDKRKEEVHALLNEAVKNMTGREITSLKDQAEIRREVNNYFYMRQKALEDAQGFLKNDKKTPEQQRDRWENHLQTKGSEATQLLSQCIKEKRSTLFTNVISDVISQESVFYLKLSNMLLPDVMSAKLLDYHAQFETEKKNLEEKWDKLINENGNVNAKIDDISEQLLEVFKEGLEKVDSANTKLRELLTLFLKDAEMLDSNSPSPPSILTPITIMVDILSTFMVTSKDLSYRFDQLYRSEESVAVIMFGNTRKSVKEFLEKTNLDIAQKDYYDAEKNALDNAKNMLTKGQQDDALEFVTKGTDITKVTLAAFTDAYNLFVNSFKEIFIGPVGDRNVDDLIKKERWDRAKNELQHLNIQTELKKIYDDNREWVDIDMFELKPEVKEKVKSILASERARLELALNQAGDNSIWESIKLFMTISKQNTFSKIKSF